MTSDLYEDGSGNWGSFGHHHLAPRPIVFWSICKRFPIVPCRHGDKMTALWSPGKLIGHPSDLKGPCQSKNMRTQVSLHQLRTARRHLWVRVRVFPTGSLHIFQFDVNVAVDVERQGGLAPGDHGSVDDTQGTAPHPLPGVSQQIQGDGICRHLSHLCQKHKHQEYHCIVWPPFYLSIKSLLLFS